MTGESLKHQTLSSLRWMASAKFAGQLINWAITIFVIRLLMPADYGLLAMANVVVALLAMFAEMGLGASLVRAQKWEAVHAAQLFGVALLVNTLICIGLIAVAPAIGAFYEEERVIPVVRVVALQFLITAGALVPDAVLRRSMRFKELSIIEIATGVVGNVTTLILAYLGHGVWSLVFGGLTATSLRTLVLHAIKTERVVPTFRWRGARSHLSFGAGVTATRLLWYVFLQCDTVIAGKMLGKEALGFYSVAVHLATLPMQRVSSFVNDVAFSAFAKIQDDRQSISSNIRLAIRLVSFFAFPALWGLAATGPDVVSAVMGERWQQAILPLQIVAAAVPLRMIGTILSTATMSVGRVDVALFTTLVGVLLAPPLFYMATQFGIVGLSVVWAALTPVMLALNVIRTTPNLGLTPLDALREMAPSASAALVMAGGVLWIAISIKTYPLISRLVVEVASGAVLYLAATALMNRRGATEAIRLIFPEFGQEPHG